MSGLQGLRRQARANHISSEPVLGQNSPPGGGLGPCGGECNRSAPEGPRLYIIPLLTKRTAGACRNLTVLKAPRLGINALSTRKHYSSGCPR